MNTLLCGTPTSTAYQIWTMRVAELLAREYEVHIITSDPANFTRCSTANRSVEINSASVSGFEKLYMHRPQPRNLHELLQTIDRNRAPNQIIAWNTSILDCFVRLEPGLRSSCLATIKAMVTPQLLVEEMPSLLRARSRMSGEAQLLHSLDITRYEYDFADHHGVNTQRICKLFPKLGSSAEHWWINARTRAAEQREVFSQSLSVTQWVVISGTGYELYSFETEKIESISRLRNSPVPFHGQLIQQAV